MDDVLAKPKQVLTLDRALALGVASGTEFDWTPDYENGNRGSVRGWYIMRQSKEIFGPDWMRDAKGKLMRFDTSQMAEDAITAASTATTSTETLRKPCPKSLK